MLTERLDGDRITPYYHILCDCSSTYSLTGCYTPCIFGTVGPGRHRSNACPSPVPALDGRTEKALYASYAPPHAAPSHPRPDTARSALRRGHAARGQRLLSQQRVDAY